MDSFPIELVQLIFTARPLHCTKPLSAANRRFRRIFCALVRKINIYTQSYDARFFSHLYPNLHTIWDYYGPVDSIVDVPLNLKVIDNCLANEYDNEESHKPKLYEHELVFFDFSVMKNQPNLQYLKLRIQGDDSGLIVPTMEKLTEMPFRIKIIISTDTDSVTWTNAAYRRAANRAHSAHFQVRASALH